MIDLLLLRLHRQNPESVANALRRTNRARMPPLHHAAHHGNAPEVIVRLLAWGGHPSALAEPIERRRIGADRGTTPLHMAVRNTGPRREAILAVLLAAGASPTVQDRGADGNGGRQALHYLMRHAPDVREVRLLLHAESARKGLIERLTDRCISRQPSVVLDDSRSTALHFAARFDAEHDVVNALVRYGFSPDELNRDGMTPLMFAASHATEAVFFLLLSKSEQPCRAGPGGHTIPALLDVNEKLQTHDPTGVSETPLGAYRSRCPS